MIPVLNEFLNILYGKKRKRKGGGGEGKKRINYCNSLFACSRSKFFVVIAYCQAEYTHVFHNKISSKQKYNLHIKFKNHALIVSDSLFSQICNILKLYMHTVQNVYPFMLIIIFLNKYKKYSNMCLARR